MKIVSPPLTSRSKTRKRTLQRMHEADKPNPKGKKNPRPECNARFLYSGRCTAILRAGYKWLAPHHIRGSISLTCIVVSSCTSMAYFNRKL